MQAATGPIVCGPDAAVRRRPAFVAAGVVVLLAAILLFVRLGHYALWDDEAGTALEAKGILRTGDTSAQPDGHNIVAFRGGAELRGLRNRYMPPLQSYLAAPFLWLGGTESALAARFVFAVLGLATVALVMAWLLRARASPLAILLVGFGCCCDVSLMLYLRQCRYYAPAAFLTTAIGFVYTRERLSRRDLGLLSALSALLFATSYLNYAGLYAALALDYLVWGRRRRKLAAADWAVLLGPQLVCALVVGFIWDPFAEHVVRVADGRHWLADRFLLLYWYLRDMDLSEFYAFPAFVAAAVAAARPGAEHLRRGVTAAVCYVFAVVLLSPQSLAVTRLADVRYLAPLIPLGIALEVGALLSLAGRRRWVATTVLMALFTTNSGNIVSMLQNGPRSAIREYVLELADPPRDPYSVTAAWIRDHVPANASLWVTPDYMTIPLIFHAPGPVYAWQLYDGARDGQFAALPAIHFRGVVPPDFIVAFGPDVRAVEGMIPFWEARGARYVKTATLDVYFKDRYRPELFWRDFRPVTSFDRNSQAIYVFRKVPVGRP